MRFWKHDESRSRKSYLNLDESLFCLIDYYSMAMFCSQQQPSIVTFHRSFSHTNRNPMPPVPVLHFRTVGRQNCLVSNSTSIDRQAEQNDGVEENQQQQDIFVSRKHNAKSTVLLLRRLSQQEEAVSVPHVQKLEEADEYQDKMLLFEMSTVLPKRNPRFPGSIEILRPPAQALAPTVDHNDDKMVRQALEIRRNVTAEILKEAMRGSKFSITYSTNLVSCLPDFVDHIMIEAASMKQMPEFSHSTFNARVKTYIHNSNVVPLIRWLKHNSLTYPQIGKVIGMSSGNLESLRYLVEWLKSIYVKGKFLGFIITKVGAILERSPEELDEIVNYLESKGIRRDWMGFIVSRCPKLLSYTMEEVKSRVNFYLEMDINEKDFGTMVFDYPKVLGFFSLEEMNSKVKYLMEFGLSNQDVGQLLAFKPQLMGFSIEERWKPLVKYLYYLGVRRDGMRRILTVKPMIFCVDLETTIAPKVRFLQDIGIREEDIGGVLVKFPPLLTYSLYKKIRPVVIFLIMKAGVTQRDIGKVIALDPALVGCSIINKLEINVKYFLSLGIPLKSLGEMVADFPMLLRYNLDVLRPKYRYLRRTMVRPLQDLIEFPRFFSYSLDGRIIPRHKVLVENRINFKLRYMLPGPDEVFDQRIKAAIERRQRFESRGIVDPFDSLATNSSMERTKVD